MLRAGCTSLQLKSLQDGVVWAHNPLLQRDNVISHSITKLYRLPFHCESELENVYVVFGAIFKRHRSNCA